MIEFFTTSVISYTDPILRKLVLNPMPIEVRKYCRSYHLHRYGVKEWAHEPGKGSYTPFAQLKVKVRH